LAKKYQGETTYIVGSRNFLYDKQGKLERGEKELKKETLETIKKKTFKRDLSNEKNARRYYNALSEGQKM